MIKLNHLLSFCIPDFSQAALWLKIARCNKMSSVAAFLGQLTSLDGLRFEERIQFYEQISTRLRSRNLVEELASYSPDSRAKFWAQALQYVVRTAHEDFNHLKKASDQRGPQHAIVVRKKKAILEAIKKLFGASRTAGCSKNAEIVSFLVTILSDSSLRIMVGEDYASFLDSNVFSCKDFVSCLPDSLLESIHNSLAAKLKTKFCSQYLSLFSQLVLIASERRCMFADVSVLANWLSATFQNKDERLFQRLVNSVDCLIKEEYFTVFFTKICVFARSLFQCFEQFFSSLMTATHEAVSSFFWHLFSNLAVNLELHDSCKLLVQEIVQLRQPLLQLLIRLREEKLIPSVRFHRADKASDFPVFYRLLAVLSSSNFDDFHRDTTDSALCHKNKRQRCASALEQACDSIESVGADDVAVILDIKLIRGLFETKCVSKAGIQKLQSTLIQVQTFHKNEVILSFLIRLVADCVLKWNVQFDEDFLESFWKFSFNMMTRKSFQKLSFQLCQALSMSCANNANVSVLNWLLFAFELSLSLSPVSVKLIEFSHVVDVATGLIDRELLCGSGPLRKCYCQSDPNLVKLARVIESTLKDFRPSSFNEFVDVAISSAFLHCCGLISNDSIVLQTLSSLLQTCDTLSDKCDLFYFADQVAELAKAVRPLSTKMSVEPIKACLLKSRALFFNLLILNTTSERDTSIFDLEDEDNEYSPSCNDTLSANDYTSACQDVAVNRQERFRHSLLKAYLRLTTELAYASSDEVLECLKRLVEVCLDSRARNSDLHTLISVLVTDFIQFSSDLDCTQHYIMQAFDVFRRCFQKHRKNQPVLLKFCEVLALFIDKLDGLCHEKLESYFNYCQELLVVIMLSQEGVACCTCLLYSWLDCVTRVCKLRPQLLFRPFKGKTIFVFLLEQFEHFSSAIASKAADVLHFVDWKDADQISAVLNTIKGLFSIEITVEDTEFLIDLKRSRIFIVKHLMTTLLHNSNGSQRGQNLLSLIQLQQEGLIDFECARSVIKSTIATRCDYAAKFYLAVCLAGWLTNNRLSQFPAALFDYSSVLQFVTACIEECACAAVLSSTSLQQITEILEQPEVLKLCQLSVFAPKFVQCFLSSSVDSLNRLKALTDFQNYEIKLICRELGRFLLTACCFLPCDLALSGSTIEELIKYCCGLLSNRQTDNPLEPFAVRSLSDLVVNVCCAAVEFWSTCDTRYKLASLVGGCNLMSYLVNLTSCQSICFSLVNLSQILNTILASIQLVVESLNACSHSIASRCFDLVLTTIAAFLGNSSFLKRLNCCLIVANVIASLRLHVKSMSQLQSISKLLNLLLNAQEDPNWQAITSQIDVPKFVAEESPCHSVFTALADGSCIVKVANAVFNSYSLFLIDSSLKSSCWCDFLATLEQSLDKAETVEDQEKIVRVAKAFNQIAVDGSSQYFKKFDLSSPTSYTELSGKLVCRGCLDHKNCQFSNHLRVIKVLINSSVSNVVEDKEAAIFCLQKVLQTDSAKSTIRHSAEKGVKDICGSLLSLGPICEEKRVRRACDWIRQSASFQDVIVALENQQKPYSTWIQDLIKAIFRTRTLSDSFVLKLQYFVERSTKFCESIFYIVLIDFLLQASTIDIERFTQVLSNLLSSCPCEKRLGQLTSFILLLHSAQVLNQTSKDAALVKLPMIEIPFLEASAAALRFYDAYLANIFLECHFSSVLTIPPEAEPILLTLVSHLANEDAVIGCQRLLSDYKKPLKLKHELLGQDFFESSDERKDFLVCCLHDLSIWHDPESQAQSQSKQNLPCARSTKGEFWSNLSLASQHILARQNGSAIEIMNFLDKKLSDFSQVHVDSNRLLFDFVEKRCGLYCLRRLLSAEGKSSELKKLSNAFLRYAEEKVANFQFCKHYKSLAVHWNLHKTITQVSVPDSPGILQFLRHCFAFKDIFVSLKCTGKAQSFISSLCERIAQRDLPEFVIHLIKFEESSLFWETGEKDVALLLGKRCLQSLESLASDQLSVDAYLNVVQRYSQWLNESKCENADSILENYLLVAERTACSSNRSNTKLHYAIAEFSDAQYTSLQNYTKSPEFQAWCSVTKQSKENACELLRAGEKSRFTSTLNKQSIIDNDRIADIHQRKASYLIYTVTNLSKCLLSGDAFNKSVYRFVDLWLNNTEDQKVAKVVASTLSRVRLDKFIPLFPQLSAQLSEGPAVNQYFQTTLSEFLGRVSILHPHHTLYNLFALAHANLDSAVAQRMQPSRTSLASRNPLSSRGKAAEKIIKQISCSSTSLNRLVTLIRQFCIAYVMLANVQLQNDAKSKSGTLTSLNAKCSLTNFRNCSEVHIPTVSLNVDPQGQYKDVVYAVQFIDEYTTAGGINLPKIISIECSDGIVRRQLIKGNDDMRQDAVMQQVFNAVNRLLSDSPAASRRQLSLSTYQVIPMSQRSGIVEWCEGTMPIGEYLAQGSKSAHVRYRPTDLTPAAARNMMETSSKLSVKDRIATYKEICSKLQPVFRHFFFERFVEPREFYMRRLTYTRSVAAWSMVGYVLGLGDRHVSNILVHSETASLFHIDLGIAFDQGKLLPTPETIPFRLTRDIVDGLGVLGVEGDFRRACEITLELLRSSTDVILTICSILLHDPLYHWTLSPERAKALQLNIPKPRAPFEPLAATGDSDSKEAGVPQRSLMAERVMLRLREKLTGREDNFSLNVEGQVSYLIKQATDPRNLALVFQGWQPYL